MSQITVLTSPIRCQHESGLSIQCIIPYLKKIIENVINKNKLGGHPAVTRSLLRGFQKINANFNYNPWHINDVGKTVIVLSGIDALKQAIEWKRKGIINQLLAGPNLMAGADEYDGILGSPEIDICLVPSDWVRMAYEEDCPVLRDRIRCWYAGVDEDYWQPSNFSNEAKRALVYWKTESEEFCQKTETILRSHGWESIRIVYGNYDNKKFKDILTKVKFAVFLSRSESQGIALAEAWAMNIPTLGWNPKQLVRNGRNYSNVSSCPFLTSNTGIEWSTIEELVSNLQQLNTKLPEYNPRAWVLEHMTDIICARNLLCLL
jgi:hypothetical protein